MGRRWMVLVVDADAEHRRCLALNLHARGYEVQMAGSGAEALRAVAAGRVDLVLLDLDLPDMDGLALLRRLRQASLVSVVVTTARDEQGDRRAARALGADGYLAKPYGMGEMLACVHTILRRGRGTGSGGQPMTGGVA